MLLKVPPEVLQGIKDTGLVRSPQLSRIFSMSAEQLMPRHQELLDSLTEQGVNRSTALAYLDVMPLLIEKRAVSAYVSAHPDLANVLPNLETPKEAASVGAREHDLTDGQQAMLETLLTHAEMRATN